VNFGPGLNPCDRLSLVVALLLTVWRFNWQRCCRADNPRVGPWVGHLPAFRIHDALFEAELVDDNCTIGDRPATRLRNLDWPG
jgi:hypothetical protein